MKILTLLISTIFYISLANAKQCYKSHFVKKGDSIYKIYTNFPHKSQYKYKAFVDVIKKENGMTKGSDILKMTNKIVSIPYKCLERKKVVKRKIDKTQKRIVKTKNNFAKRYDVLGLQATKTNLKKFKRKTDKKSDLDIYFRSSSGSYSDNNIKTNELNPVILTLRKKSSLGLKDTNTTTVINFSNPIYTNGLDKNISNTNFEVSQLISHKINSFVLEMGPGFRSQSYLNNSLTGTQSIDGITITLTTKYNFEINYRRFSLGLDTYRHVLQTNTSKENSGTSQSARASASCSINKSLDLSIFNEMNTIQTNSNNVNALNYGLGLNLKI